MEPLTLIIYGPDGMGKTTFGSFFPDPIFIGPEIKGSRFLKGIERDKSCRTYEQVMEKIKKLTNEPSSRKTVVIDSLDHIELDIHDVIKKKYGVANLAKAAGGFGAGFKEAAEMQYAMAEALEELQEKKNMNIVLIAHSKVQSFNDPLTEEPYDRYELKLHESGSTSPRAMWREMADAVFFLNESVATKGEGKSARAISDGNKYLHTQRTTSYDAKCRFPMPAKVAFDLTVNVYKLIHEFAFGDNDVPVFERAMGLYKSLPKEDKTILEFLTKNKDNEANLRRSIIKLEGMV